MKHKLLIFLGLNCALLPATLPVEETNAWRFDASLNLFLVGLSGDVTAKGVPTHVDPSFSDIFEHLEAGFAGRATVGCKRWLLSTEFSYMRLSTS